jgi:ATP phosphoribosyltransferase regulatory subunit
LCYKRQRLSLRGRTRGTRARDFQLGAELIGLSALSADAEMLALAVDVLDRFGLGRHGRGGHVDFSRLAAEADASPELAQQLEDAVAKKERSRVIDLLTSGGHARAAAARLAGLLDLMGPETVLARAMSVVDNPSARTRWRRSARSPARRGPTALRSRWCSIRGDPWQGILLRLIFELFADGVGYEVGRGGRYDDLIGRYGSPEPSTGFAIHLERLQQGLDRTSARAPVTSVQALVVANGGSGPAIRLARELRGAGLPVAMWNEDGRGPAEYARALGIPWVVAPGPVRRRVTLTSMQSGRSRGLSVGACVALLSRRRPPHGRTT